MNNLRERERSRRGQSLNQTVIDLLSQRLGVGTTRTNSLARLAGGGWSEDEYERFARYTAGFERVDEDMWR